MNRARIPRTAPLVAQAHADSPLGPVLLAATAKGLAGLWFEGQKHHPGPLAAPVDPGQRFIAGALAELARYWAGEPVAFATPLDPAGTPFRRAVWQALRQIPRGRTTTYGEIAALLGRPAASRAVGAAVGRNPLSVIVPCHRVLGGNGALTGYAGGLERKRALLGLEGVVPAQARKMLRAEPQEPLLPTTDLATRIRARFASLGDVDLELAPRDDVPFEPDSSSKESGTQATKPRTPRR